MADRIYVETKINDTVIAALDKSSLLGLDKATIDRTELFLFAMAVGVRAGKRVTLGPKVALVLESALTNNEWAKSAMYSLLVDELRKTGGEENIGNKDVAYEIAQEYANTGFHIIGEWLVDLKQRDEQALMWEMISLLDATYESIFVEMP